MSSKPAKPCKLTVTLLGPSGSSVVGVSAGCLLPVDVGGWEEFGESVGGDADLPVVSVDEPVVVATQQCRIVQGRNAAVGPVFDVVPVAPAGRAVAAGEGASAVS